MIANVQGNARSKIWTPLSFHKLLAGPITQRCLLTSSFCISTTPGSIGPANNDQTLPSSINGWSLQGWSSYLQPGSACHLIADGLNKTLTIKNFGSVTMLRGRLTACFQSTFGDPFTAHPVIVFISTVINDWSQVLYAFYFIGRHIGPGIRTGCLCIPVIDPTYFCWCRSH